MDTRYAYFAGGCFWGVEYFFNQEEGVIEALSGYMGGDSENPTYKDVCYKDTGHLEVVRVEYNPKEVTYEALAKLFFEIHNPSQENGQGPDIGSQYLSAIFVNDDTEKSIIEDLINQLEKKGLYVATKILSMATFYKAEDYHQRYYEKTGKMPYCHSRVSRF